jgi:hypothetical protein
MQDAVDTDIPNNHDSSNDIGNKKEHRQKIAKKEKHLVLLVQLTT